MKSQAVGKGLKTIGKLLCHALDIALELFKWV
jgi:hypothetical protein